MHFKDEQPLVFAALYDSWEDAEGNFVLVPCVWINCNILFALLIERTV